MLPALLLSFLQAAVPLKNPSFEERGEGIPGWRLGDGAQSGPDGKKASSTVDRASGHGDQSSLLLRGDRTTDEWGVVFQEFGVAGGEEVDLRFWAKADDVKQEGRQFANANALLQFFDGDGTRLLMESSDRVTGTRDWSEVTVHCEAPGKARKASVAFFLSMSGTLWIDDVRIAVKKHAPWSPALAPEAWRILVDRLCATYPFAGEKGGVAAFRARADKLQKRAASSDSRPHFVMVMQELLDPLHDLHVWLEVDDKVMPTGLVKEVPRNSNIVAAQQELDETLMFDGTDIVGRTKDGIAYVRVGSLARGEGPIRRILATRNQLKTARALVLDLRDNAGGSEAVGRLIAEQFTDQARVYAKRRTRQGDGFGPWQEVSFGPAPGGKADLRPLVVLQGPHTVSSGEGLLQMLRTLPQCTTVGLPSRGASGNPQPVRLSGDLRVFASTWQDALPDGTVIEGKGIAPKVTVDLPEAAYKLADPTLLRALELLRK